MRAKKKLKKCEEQIKSIIKNPDDYDEKYTKIKLNSDDQLPLSKTIEIPTMKIVVRAVFHENNKYYQQIFLDVCINYRRQRRKLSCLMKK